MNFTNPTGKSTTDPSMYTANLTTHLTYFEPCWNPSIRGSLPSPAQQGNSMWQRETTKRPSTTVATNTPWSMTSLTWLSSQTNETGPIISDARNTSNWANTSNPAKMPSTARTFNPAKTRSQTIASATSRMSLPNLTMTPESAHRPNPARAAHWPPTAASPTSLTWRTMTI